MTDKENARKFMGDNFGDDELGSEQHADLLRTLTLFSKTVRTEATRAERERVTIECEAIIEEQISLIRQSGGWSYSDLQSVQHKIAAICARTATEGEGKQPFKPAIMAIDGITTFIIEDVPQFVRSFAPGIETVHAMEDERLIGVQIAAPQPPASPSQEGEKIVTDISAEIEGEFDCPNEQARHLARRVFTIAKDGGFAFGPPQEGGMREALEQARQCIFENTWRVETRIRLIAKIDAELAHDGGRG